MHQIIADAMEDFNQMTGYLAGYFLTKTADPNAGSVKEACGENSTVSPPRASR